MLSTADFKSDAEFDEASLRAISIASSISVAGSFALLTSRFLTSPTPMMIGIFAIVTGCRIAIEESNIRAKLEQSGRLHASQVVIEIGES